MDFLRNLRIWSPKKATYHWRPNSLIGYLRQSPKISELHQSLRTAFPNFFSETMEVDIDENSPRNKTLVKRTTEKILVLRFWILRLKSKKPGRTFRELTQSCQRSTLYSRLTSWLSAFRSAKATLPFHSTNFWISQQSCSYWFKYCSQTSIHAERVNCKKTSTLWIVWTDLSKRTQNFRVLYKFIWHFGSATVKIALRHEQQITTLLFL